MTRYVATDKVEIELTNFCQGGSIVLSPGEELEREHSEDGALWFNGERFSHFVDKHFRGAIEDGRLIECDQ